MERVYSVMINVAPIITVLLYLIIRKVIILGKNFFVILTGILGGFYFGLFLYLSKYPYGNIVVVLIMQVIYVCFFTFFFYITVLEIHTLLDLLLLLIYFANIIYGLRSIYERLKLEKIIEIVFLDKIIYRLESTDYVALIINFLENEWFKGIVIASMGGIISGLVLKKLNKEGK